MPQRWDHTDSDGEIVRFTTSEDGKTGYLTVSNEEGPRTGYITKEAAAALAAQLQIWAGGF